MLKRKFALKGIIKAKLYPLKPNEIEWNEERADRLVLLLGL